MTDKKYKFWLAVVDGQLVQFAELPHMMATALHPDAGDVELALCEIEITAELKQAVADGNLIVRNPNTLGRHTLPLGNALQRAVFIPDTDLEPFLNARGIELRITPHGNGPDYWTLENAAAAIQEQLNWHNGTRREFKDDLQRAAQSGALVILSPSTLLPVRPKHVRTHWEYVTPESVNTWLATLKAPYCWRPEPAAIGAALDATKPPEQTELRPLPTNTIAQLFDGISFAQDRWVKNIGQAKWLASANRGKGEQGGAPATWCPLTIARLVCDRGKNARAKQKTLTSLNSRFRTNLVLKPWKDEWDDYYGMFTEPGEA